MRVNAARDMLILGGGERGGDDWEGLVRRGTRSGNFSVCAGSARLGTDFLNPSRAKDAHSLSCHRLPRPPSSSPTSSHFRVPAMARNPVVLITGASKCIILQLIFPT